MDLYLPVGLSRWWLMHMMQVSSIIRILLRRYWYLTMCAASIARHLGAESPKTTPPCSTNVVRQQHQYVLSHRGVLLRMIHSSPYLLQS